VSKPSFDPNDLASPGTLERLSTDPLRPLIDRTLEKPYRPASTFKVVTAVAALENGLVSPGEEMTCSGTRSVGQHVLRDMDVHGTLDLLDALQRSCNVYFWTLAERAGIDRLAAVARDFGFGARTGLGINGDVAGQVPDQRLYSGNADADLELTLNTAVGLGDVKVTVVQLAMAYAALANGGRLFVPQVVRRLESARGEVIADRPPVLRRSLHASAPTLDIIRRGMTRAVNRRGGTAFKARKGAVKMVGKTGTFEAPDRPDPVETADAWFAGWAPQERPRIAVVVLVERGGIGGAVAAPVARAIIDGYYTRGDKPPKRRAAAHARRKKEKKKNERSARARHGKLRRRGDL
jgi:penicillin-binding protein 2